jgi:hypothetical protein
MYVCSCTHTYNAYNNHNYLLVYIGLPEGLILTVLSQLKPLFHVKNDIIARQGEVGNEMFFLQKGTIEVFCTVPEANAEVTIGYKSNSGHFGGMYICFYK